MNKKRKSIIGVLAILLCLSIAAFASPALAKYVKSVIVTDSLSLEIIAEEEGPYSIVYHSYTDEGEDYVYYTQKCVWNKTYTVIDMPRNEEGGIWTIGGVTYSSGSANQVNGKKWSPGDSISINEAKEELSYHKGNSTDTMEVHLFDVYSTSPKLIVQCDYLSYFDGYNDGRYVQYTVDTITDYQQAQAWEDTYTCWSDETRNIERRYFAEKGGESSIPAHVNTFNVHPGIYVIPVGSRVDMGSAWSYISYIKWDTYTSTGVEIGDGNKLQNARKMGMEDLRAFVGHNNHEWLEDNLNQCFAEGTLITLPNGSRVPVEELSAGDTVMVYDHENGCYTSAPILFIEDDGVKEYNVINLKFSDGTHTKLIYEHGLFDLDLNKYVYITEDNYSEFVGHSFAKESDSGYETAVLQNAYVEKEVIGCYSLTTNYHLNYFIDGMFSMPGGITGLFNYFECGENLAYNQELMQADIEKYGLYTPQDFADYLPEEVFNEIYPVKYLKVSVGKGLMTFEDALAIIERYVMGHGLV